MKHEHALGPVEQKFLASAREALRSLRQDYLAALGLAKEIETTRAALEASMNQQIVIIAGGLPPAPKGYQVSEDGLKLVGEIAEPAPAPPPPTLKPNGGIHATA